jgi:phage pi2 protein 07
MYVFYDGQRFTGINQPYKFNDDLKGVRAAIRKYTKQKALHVPVDKYDVIAYDYEKLIRQYVKTRWSHERILNAMSDEEQDKYIEENLPDPDHNLFLTVSYSKKRYYIIKQGDNWRTYTNPFEPAFEWSGLKLYKVNTVEVREVDISEILK